MEIIFIDLSYGCFCNSWNFQCEFKIRFEICLRIILTNFEFMMKVFDSFVLVEANTCWAVLHNDTFWISNSSLYTNFICYSLQPQAKNEYLPKYFLQFQKNIPVTFLPYFSVIFRDFGPLDVYQEYRVIYKASSNFHQ